MQVAATSLHPKEIEILARQFGTMPGLNERAGADHQILRHGQPERQLPACYSCHASDKPSPVIIGQKASYTSARLNQWRGDPGVVDAKKSSETMAAIARRIPIGQVEAISATLAGSSDQADR
jgi:cytochrome c553